MPSPVRFAAVRRLLEKHGWALVRISSSHHVFKKTGERDFVVPVKKGLVKPFYVQEIEKHVGEKA